MVRMRKAIRVVPGRHAVRGVVLRDRGRVGRAAPYQTIRARARIVRSSRTPRDRVRPTSRECPRILRRRHLNFGYDELHHCRNCAPGPSSPHVFPADAMNVDLQPTLRGSLLELRPLRADDWDALYAVASDPLIWEQHPERERYKEDVFREFFRVALESKAALVAIDVNDGSIVGSSRYHGYDAAARVLEIGWTFLARSHWGGRFNREMKHLMLQHAFRYVDNVIFLIGPQNYRSRQAIERIGGVLTGSQFEGGQESVVYRIGKGSAGVH